ncbi:MAG: zf-HC2 domain-containing protein [Chloroflexi bacterium CFX4]|nr:zf-HC2 domain-containing protein [Chloroflexi bacterium CFX4]MDL1921707.1 zf-HC2 domain-containing protein [Chloroflexi bacterium CFX3]
MMPPQAPEEFDLLSAYLDGVLSARQREALEARLAESPDLRAQLDDLRALRATLRAAPTLQPPRNFTLDPALYARKAWWSRAGVLRTLGSLSAAAAALLIFFGVLLSTPPESPASSGVALQPTLILRDAATPTLAMLIVESSATASAISPAAAPPMPATVAAQSVTAEAFSAAPTEQQTRAALGVTATMQIMATAMPAFEATEMTQRAMPTPTTFPEIALLMATETSAATTSVEEASDAAGIGESALPTATARPMQHAAEEPEVTPTPSEVISPTARLIVVLGIILLIIGGVLYLIGTFRVRT